jgi:hypothetical protein
VRQVLSHVDESDRNGEVQVHLQRSPDEAVPDHPFFLLVCILDDSSTAPQTSEYTDDDEQQSTHSNNGGSQDEQEHGLLQLAGVGVEVQQLENLLFWNPVPTSEKRSLEEEYLEVGWR